MTGNNLITRLLQTTAIIALGTSAIPTASFAQDQASADADEEVLEEVIVTGSRIRRDTFTSSAPMDVVMADVAELEGIPDVATLLQTTTIAAGSPQVNAVLGTEFNQNGGAGAATLSLRGLGANRTLVLLNGRRAGPAGTRGGVSSFDLNVIPLAAIERVEILKDGASSIYGSDAVAGVVNIITSKEEGGELNAFYSQPFKNGGEELRINGSWGKKTDRGYFRGTVDYFRQSELARGDRDFLECGHSNLSDPTTGASVDLIDPRTGVRQCRDLLWGHVWVYDYASYYGPGTTNAGLAPFLMQFDFDGQLAANNIPPLASDPTNIFWLGAPAGWFPVNRTPQNAAIADYDHPFQDQESLIPKIQTATLFLEGEYDVLDEVTAYGEVLLNRRKTYTNDYRQYWTYIYNSNWDFSGGDPGSGGGDPFSPGWTGANWISPTPITDWADSSETVDYLRFVGGLKGELNSFLPGWFWDLSYQYSKSDGDYYAQQIFNDSIQDNWFRTASCVGTTSSVEGLPCVDINWVSPELMRGNPTAAEQAFLFGEETGNTKYTQWSMEGYTSGEIFDLPAGAVAIAIGFHYRRDKINDVPGPITQAANAWGSTAAGITAGKERTSAFFGEVDIPLITGKTFFESFTLNASARYTDVRSSGDDVTYKVGLNWAITPQIRIRGTYGTSFRTPALFELFLADQTSFSSPRIDPCLNWAANLAAGNISQETADNCAADGVPPVFNTSITPTAITGGGFGVLSAETSTSKNIGIVLRPDFADLSISVDYFDIEVKNEVSQIGPGNIVQGCYASDFFPNDPLCDLFDRNPPTAAALPNQITTIRDSFINVAQQRNRGLDVAVVYRTEIPWGALTIQSQHTFQFEDLVGLFADTTEDFNGEVGDPKWVGNLDITFERGPWGFFWGIDFIGSGSNETSFGGNTVTFFGQTVAGDLTAEFTMYHDISLSRNFSSGLVVRVGIANLFDERPPILSNFAAFGDEFTSVGDTVAASQYDWRMRRAFLNVTKKF